eukprot:411024_1
MEAKSLLFFGTLLVRGHCTGVVIATGDHTLMGRIARLADETEMHETPIAIELDNFVKKISILAVVIALIFGSLSFMKASGSTSFVSNFAKAVVFFIGILVANVPEGLLATVTVSLTLTAKRMSKKAVLVKNMEAVEALGSTNVICSDKTGTLTMNVMTVAHVFYDMDAFEVDTSDPMQGEFDDLSPCFQKLVRCAVLCNNAKFTKSGNIDGDASETALLKMCAVHVDHDTKAAIARQVNIIDETAETVEEIAAKRGVKVRDVREFEARAAVVTGARLNEELGHHRSEAQKARFWNSILLKDCVVFARTSPQQKLLIVQACQERGGVVAVTGDGVNDSPALKQADIGVAMGKTGTDVAKDAADMILLDDNFASIVGGVEEGRIIFDNLKKSLSYTLSSNVPELLPFLLFVMLGIPIPLETIHILLIDMGTDLLPAISYAYEVKESNIMRRAPRDPKKDHLVTWKLINFAYLQIGILQFMAGMYTYLVVLRSKGLM